MAESHSASALKLLIAASGTGGHLFPAIATAEQLPDVQIEWLGVPNRLETRLVPDRYLLHRIAIEGFQQRFGWATVRIFSRQLAAIWQVRELLRRGEFQAVLTTGGYIAAPAIVAARWLGLPVLLHESNAMPGKVTRWLSPWCSVVALGFAEAAQYLPHASTVPVGTPVRMQFRSPAPTTLSDLPIPTDAPLIVVVGGSQGAVAVNRLVRQSAAAWLEAGVWIVHLTGENDPDLSDPDLSNPDRHSPEMKVLSHSHYLPLPFYDNMAGLLQRANLAISRAGAGTLTELAVTQTPAILIPYPYAADDHQTANAEIFARAGAAQLVQQADLTPEMLQQQVLHLLQSPDELKHMSEAMQQLAIVDSAEQLAVLIKRMALK